MDFKLSLKIERFSLFVRLSTYLSFHPPLYLSFYISVYWSLPSSFCPSVPYVFLSLSLSICLFCRVVIFCCPFLCLLCISNSKRVVCLLLAGGKSSLSALSHYFQSKKRIHKNKVTKGLKIQHFKGEFTYTLHF